MLFVNCISVKLEKTKIKKEEFPLYIGLNSFCFSIGICLLKVGLGFNDNAIILPL